MKPKFRRGSPNKLIINELRLLIAHKIGSPTTNLEGDHGSGIYDTDGGQMKRKATKGKKQTGPSIQTRILR